MTAAARIQALRQRIGQEPPIGYVAEALDLLPALLDVAEAARLVVDRDIDPAFIEDDRALADLEGAILRLEAAGP